MYTFLQQALPRVVIHRTQVAKNKCCEHGSALRKRTAGIKRRFHRRLTKTVFRSRLEQKTPLTEELVCCVSVLFSMAKSILRMGVCSFLLPYHFIPSH